MDDIKEITEALHQFRDERDWAQFHNPKDRALALNIEAGELLNVSKTYRFMNYYDSLFS